MSLSKETNDARRRRPGYIAPCPLCSFVGQQDFPDKLVYPSEVTSRHNGQHGLIACCKLSSKVSFKASREELALAWHQARQQSVPIEAEESRRLSTLEKFKHLNLEPLYSLCRTGKSQIP